MSDFMLEGQEGWMLPGRDKWTIPCLGYG